MKLMRTTLDIDDDVLQAAKGIAKTQSQTLGQVISALVRQSLGSDQTARSIRNGVPLFTPKPASTRPDLSLVNALRDE
jgi:Arc/MetJ family transcription regulator